MFQEYGCQTQRNCNKGRRCWERWVCIVHEEHFLTVTTSPFIVVYWTYCFENTLLKFLIFSGDAPDKAATELLKRVLKDTIHRYINLFNWEENFRDQKNVDPRASLLLKNHLIIIQLFYDWNSLTGFGFR